MLIFGIIISLIIFSLIVLLHEYGHYKTARVFGITVEEFGLGIPPRAKKLWKNSSGTLFSLNWIPLGGFVKIKGENAYMFLAYNAEGKHLSIDEIREILQSKGELFHKDGKKLSKGEIYILEEEVAAYKVGENFYEKNIFQKTAVLIAGVMMNFLLAWGILTIVFWIGTKPLGINTIIETNSESLIIPSYTSALESGLLIQQEGIILSPAPGSIAEASGIESGDLLESIDNISFQSSEAIISYISSKAGTQVTLYISDNIIQECDSLSCEKDLEVTVGDDGKIGSYLSDNISLNEDYIVKYSLFPAIMAGFRETLTQIELTYKGIIMLGSKMFFPETKQERQEAMDQMSGPIGVVNIVSNSLGEGIIFLLLLSALISVNLGVFNLLPIPALDGGRIALLWIRTLLEKIFGKNNIGEKIENLIHVSFFLLLIALSIIISYNDIIKIVNR